MNNKKTYQDFMEKVFEFQKAISKYNEFCSYFSKNCSCEYDLHVIDVEKQQLEKYKTKLNLLFESLNKLQTNEMTVKFFEGQLRMIKRHLLAMFAKESGLSINELKSEFRSLE